MMIALQSNWPFRWLLFCPYSGFFRLFFFLFFFGGGGVERHLYGLRSLTRDDPAEMKARLEEAALVAQVLYCTVLYCTYPPYKFSPS